MNADTDIILPRKDRRAGAEGTEYTKFFYPCAKPAFIRS